MNTASATAATATTSAPFGVLLRQRRAHSGLSQMALALQSEVSMRHLSWLETGKAQPSRAMVLRLAEQLDLPLRERNLWLTTAGFAPLYRDAPLDATAPAHALIQQLLNAHEPAPAVAIDRHWNLVASNRLVPVLLQHVKPQLLRPPVNVLLLSLHPEGLAPFITNFGAWRAHVLARLRRQMHITADTELLRLHQTLSALPGPTAQENGHDHSAMNDVAVPLHLHGPFGALNFITTITVFGAPNDVSLSELAIETLLPADAATASALRAIHAKLV
jgi:transcriptional regulator with XRE-family HTH domain